MDISFESSSSSNDEAAEEGGLKKKQTMIYRKKTGKKDEDGSLSSVGSQMTAFNKEDYVSKRELRQTVKSLKALIIELREQLIKEKGFLETHSLEVSSLVRQEIIEKMILQDDQIQSTKEDLILSHKKLARERSDF